MTFPAWTFPVKRDEYRVVDGDTVAVHLDRGWSDTRWTLLRLQGLNAPETRTRDLLEKRAGLAVKQLVVQWFQDRVDQRHLRLYASSEQKPKYAGRTVGRIWVQGELDTLECLNRYLLTLEVVVPYGGGRRQFTRKQLSDILKRAQRGNTR